MRRGPTGPLRRSAHRFRAAADLGPPPAPAEAAEGAMNSPISAALRLLRLLWSLLLRALDAVGLGSFFFGGGTSGSGSGRIVTFDDGRSVRIGRRIAEGGFSFVFEARDVSPGRRPYALKRVHCGDRDAVQQCRKEAGVHRTFDHPNLMPLLGLKFESSTAAGSAEVCYMLFPYVPLSLRSDMTARRLLDDDVTDESQRRPYSEREVLIMFAGIVDAVRAMHSRGLSHRDVKVENVLLRDDDGGGGGGGSDSRGRRVVGRGVRSPVLMDFGSSGPLTEPVRSRSDALRIAEEAAQHTTLPYRAPELFDGGVRHSPTESLDYGRADVWSLGCVLFGMMYGSSPFEVEFRSDGTARIVDCTHLRVLGPVPFPPGGSHADRRYGEGAKELVRWTLNQARGERPGAEELGERVGRLLGDEGGGGAKGQPRKGPRSGAGVNGDPFDSIVTRQSNVV